jgi:hypothetical protein
MKYHFSPVGKPAAQAGCLHFLDDPLATLLHDLGGAVPIAALARAVEAPVVEAVKIGEYAIFIFEHA